MSQRRPSQPEANSGGSRGRRLLVELLEHSLLLRNRLRRVGWPAGPNAGCGGLDPGQQEQLCLTAGRDYPAFLRAPAPLPSAGEMTLELLRETRAGRLELLRFDSPQPSGEPSNDRVSVLIHRPRGESPSDRVVLFHHALYQDRWRLWSWFLEPLLGRVPVAMMHAPWHGPRTPAGEHPGARSVNASPWCVFAASRQWCADAAQTQRLLEERCRLNVAAVMGFSMGAHMALLQAAIEGPRLPLVAVAPTNDYAHGILNGCLTQGIRRAIEQHGPGARRFAELTAAIVLDRYVAPLAGHPVLLARGIWDCVDPAPSGDRLEAALRPERCLRLPAGHGSLFLDRRRILAATLGFLETHGVLEEPRPRPPGG